MAKADARKALMEEKVDDKHPAESSGAFAWLKSKKAMAVSTPA
jgi:hypothetical protein